MGLWGAELDFRLPDALPPLPARARSLPDIEVEAVARRVDLQIARINLSALAQSYGVTKATRFINILDAGYADKIVGDKQLDETFRMRGFALDLQIPLFDFGEVRVREAEATYMQAVNRLLERAVNVRSQARDAYRVYRSTYDIARHYRREVLPLRKIISDETLLRYNAMLIDVFALLAEARQRINVTIAAIDAQRAFWLASVDLRAAVVGGGTASETTDPTRSAVAAPAGEQSP
jgi:outer membrane protein TolC